MVSERAHKMVHLFSPFVCVVLLCAVDFSPTSQSSGAKIVGGFLRSEKRIFLFFSLFSASFFVFFLSISLARARPVFPLRLDFFSFFGTPTRSK